MHKQGLENVLDCAVLAEVRLSWETLYLIGPLLGSLQKGVLGSGFFRSVLQQVGVLVLATGASVVPSPLPRSAGGFVCKRQALEGDALVEAAAHICLQPPLKRI